MLLPKDLIGRRAISIHEYARMFGIRPKTVYNQISAGACPVRTFKLGGRRLVRVEDLPLDGDSYPLNIPTGTRKSSTRRR